MDDPLKSLLTVYLGQVDSAMKISEILSLHGGEEKISEDNVIIGLIYRLMNPMSDEELTTSLENAKKIINNIEEDDGEDDEEYINIDENQYRYIKKNNCNCNLCAKARADLINYKNYEPPDQLTQIFKNSIDEACNKGKLLI